MYNENVDPKQGYKHAKFERFCLNSIREKGDIKKIADNMWIISLEHVRISKIVTYT